jgi:hypothetical protein
VTKDDGSFGRSGRAAENGGNPMTLVVLERKRFVHAAAL